MRSRPAGPHDTHELETCGDGWGGDPRKHRHRVQLKARNHNVCAERQHSMSCEKLHEAPGAARNRRFARHFVAGFPAIGAPRTARPAWRRRRRRRRESRDRPAPSAARRPGLRRRGAAGPARPAVPRTVSASPRRQGVAAETGQHGLGALSVARMARVLPQAEGREVGVSVLARARSPPASSEPR